MVPRTLFVGLVDDAALFPPGNAPMVRALEEHTAHRSAWYADLVGPFLCRASRVDELVGALSDEDRLRLAIVVDGDGDTAHASLRAAAADPRLDLVGVEAAADHLGEDAVTVGANLAHLRDVSGVLEVPRSGFDPALDLVGRSGWQVAKYRTGGTTTHAFPSEVELAAFLVAAVARQIPFKLTAGLHHAVRNTDNDSGFEQHGVLNVLVATRVAQQVGSVADVAAVLARRVPAELVEFVEVWDESTCTGVRRAFRSFGCCGVTDPIHELASLGLVVRGPG